MTTADIISNELLSLADSRQADHLMRFFKTGPGEYGEGDMFLGIRVPKTREVVKRHSRETTLADIDALTSSKWHEIRLAGFITLTDMFARAARRRDNAACDAITNFYLDIIDRANNWDLVDLSAPKILGSYLLSNPDRIGILHELAAMTEKLWHQRVAIVSTLTLIKGDQYEATISISEKYLSHRHDLIHKATGWMLREVGKRIAGLPVLLAFLDENTHAMPRTMLRYAIEKLPDELRQHYMTLPSDAKSSRTRIG